MKRLNTLLFVLIIIPFSLMGQSLSFSEAVENLKQGNKKLKGFEKQAEVAHLNYQATKGLYFPKISLNANYIHMNDNLYLNFNKYRNRLANFIGLNAGILGDWRVQFQEQNISRVSADLVWPVFTGGEIRAGIKANKLKVNLADAETNKLENTLISNLVERYFQTQLAKEVINVRKQVLDAAKKHLYNAEKLEKNGIIAPIETMQAKTAVADAERELLSTLKDEELAKTTLIGLMGQQNVQLDLITPLFEVRDLKPLTYYQDLAKENYPDIVKARIKKEMTKQNKALKKGKFIPDVAIVGKKYLYTENLPITEPDWYVGVGMKVDVFEGLKKIKEYKQATALSQSIDLITTQAQVDIQTLVKKYYTEILKQQEQIESLEKSISFAKEVVRVRNKAFKEGFATSVDVADANLYLASIKIKRLKALFESDKALANLLETCGDSMLFLNFTR